MPRCRQAPFPAVKSEDADELDKRAVHESQASMRRKGAWLEMFGGVGPCRTRQTTPGSGSFAQLCKATTSLGVRVVHEL